MQRSDLRKEVRRRGLAWAAVAAAIRWVWEAEREKRAHANAVRETAWVQFTANSPGCHSFWRGGFRYRFKHRFARGEDYTCIPGYDEIAQEMATIFPEYDHDRGTEELWDFLLSPYNRLPPAEEVYNKALELVERENSRKNEMQDDVMEEF